MTSKYPKECARCGRSKPPWFEFCPNCYAVIQTEQLEPNTCDEQDCNEVIADEHYLCRAHWNQLRQGTISECGECSEYKPADYPLCRRCNSQSVYKPARHSQTNRRQGSTSRPQIPSTRRAYDHHDGEDDAKAKDKRFWFNRQDNGVCNYCGNRYPYDQLQMEHMVPKELGGPDHRRNMQLTCRTCNILKGTSTDLEFRDLNASLIPTEERTPPRRSVDPKKLKAGTQGRRYREQTNSRDRTQSNRSQRPRQRRPGRL